MATNITSNYFQPVKANINCKYGQTFITELEVKTKGYWTKNTHTHNQEKNYIVNFFAQNHF